MIDPPVAPGGGVRSAGVVLGVALALALGPAGGLALELGAVRVASRLGQPLRAEIPLELTAAERSGGLTVEVPGYWDQRALGAEPIGADSVSASVSGDGAVLIRLHSQRALNEPVVDFLLRLRVGAVRSVHEISFLVDPPGGLIRAPAPRTTARPVVRATPRPAVGPAASRVATRGTYGPVAQGETLYRIASRLAPDGARGVARMMSRIVAANPRAFIDGAPGRLLAGAVLAIPRPAGQSAASARLAAPSPAVASAPAPASTPTSTSTSTPTLAPTPESADSTAPVPSSANAPRAPPSLATAPVTSAAAAAGTTAAVAAGATAGAPEAPSVDADVVQLRESIAEVREGIAASRDRQRDLVRQIEDRQATIAALERRIAEQDGTRAELAASIEAAAAKAASPRSTVVPMTAAEAAASAPTPAPARPAPTGILADLGLDELSPAGVTALVRDALRRPETMAAIGILVLALIGLMVARWRRGRTVGTTDRERKRANEEQAIHDRLADVRDRVNLEVVSGSDTPLNPVNDEINVVEIASARRRRK